MELATAINECKDQDKRLDQMSLRLESALNEIDKARRITKDALLNLESMLTREIADEKGSGEYRNRMGCTVRDLGGMTAEEARWMLNQIKALTSFDDRDIAYEIGLSPNTIKNWRLEYVNLSSKSARALKSYYDRVISGVMISKPQPTTLESGLLNNVRVTTDKALPESRLLRLLVASMHMLKLDQDVLKDARIPWEKLKYVIGAACLAAIGPSVTARFFKVSESAVASTAGPGLNRKEREIARRILQIEVQFMADHGCAYE